MGEDNWTEPSGDRPERNQRPEPAADVNWERDLLNRLAFASLNEQRRARRWGILFKILIFLYLFGLLFMARTDQWNTSAVTPGKHTALVELDGVIAAGSPANADTLVTGLRDAFEAKKVAGIILRINSPGGSPVQAAYINNEIARLREKYPDKPIHTVVSDVCASGGYYVAVATDKIFVNESSIIGSIGVRMDSFGFVDAIDKLGVERRLLTAGENKAFLDPFLPAREEDVEHVEALLDEVHQQFIDTVKEGRGDRLSDDPAIFSGLIWTGVRGVELGLADDFGSAGQVARDVIGAEDIVDYTPRPDFFERFAREFGASVGQALGTTLGLDGARLE